MHPGLRLDIVRFHLVRFLAGMQSAALGFMLAQAHFADPMVAVPSAVSVVFMVRTF